MLPVSASMNRIVRSRRHWLLGATGLSLGAAWLLGAGLRRGLATPVPDPLDWGAPPARGERLPALALRGLDDRPQPLPVAHDQLRVLNFWARWCGPCRRELPGLGRLAQRLAGESIPLLAIALDDDAFALREYLHPLSLGGLSVLRLPAGEPLALSALPQTWVIGRQGQVLARMVGAREWDHADWASRIIELDRQDRLQAMT